MDSVDQNCTRLAALENTQRADDHGDEGKVEDEQRDDKSKQVDCQAADDEEENQCVDVLRGDDRAQPLDSGPRRPVDQVLFHLNNGMQRVLQHLRRDQKDKDMHNIQQTVSEL